MKLIHRALLLVVGCAISSRMVLADTPPNVSELQAPAVQRAALHLAREAIRRYLADKSIAPVPADCPVALRRRFGVFVTIEKEGRIAPRGCRGTLQPSQDSLADEIVHNAIAACSRDRAEPPLLAEELPHCLISLTVVWKTEAIANINQHDAQHNGLIARQGSRIGIVLPYEGHDANTQLLWAKRKAGLADTADVQLEELYAIRFRDNATGN
jgi:AMMECR1 domain-containing protein